MTNKTDKIRRQKTLLQQLNNDSYDKEVFMSTFHIQERTIRRDLNELAEKGELFTERLQYLRKKCLGQLTKKVHDGVLPPHLMVQIALSGEPKRIEAYQEIRHIELSWKVDESPTKNKVQTT